MNGLLKEETNLKKLLKGEGKIKKIGYIKQKPQFQQLPNQKKSKLFKLLAPIVFWLMISLTILFVSLTIKKLCWKCY